MGRPVDSRVIVGSAALLFGLVARTGGQLDVVGLPHHCPLAALDDGGGGIRACDTRSNVAHRTSPLFSNFRPFPFDLRQERAEPDDRPSGGQTLITGVLRTFQHA